jgi:hypothetical protein
VIRDDKGKDLLSLIGVTGTPLLCFCKAKIAGDRQRGTNRIMIPVKKVWKKYFSKTWGYSEAS